MVGGRISDLSSKLLAEVTARRFQMSCLWDIPVRLPQAMEIPYKCSLALWTEPFLLKVMETPQSLVWPRAHHTPRRHWWFWSRLALGQQQYRTESPQNLASAPHSTGLPQWRHGLKLHLWQQLFDQLFIFLLPPHHIHSYYLAEILNIKKKKNSIFRFDLWTFLDINFKHGKHKRKIRMWKLRWHEKVTGSNKHRFSIVGLVPVHLL